MSGACEVDDDDVVAAGCDSFVVKMFDIPDGPVAGQSYGVKAAPCAG